MFKYIEIWVLAALAASVTAAASTNILVTPHLEVAVTAVTQEVSFLLDESGVSVESSMELAFKQKGPPAAARRMVCHTPFLFCLQRKGGEHPYFVMWVADEELMVPSG